jgi:putative flippase GtrA
MAQTAGFYLVFTPASTLLGNYLAEGLLWNEYLVTVINMVLNFVLEYLFQRFVVFRNSIDTNDLAQKETKE